MICTLGDKSPKVVARTAKNPGDGEACIQLKKMCIYTNIFVIKKLTVEVVVSSRKHQPAA